MKKKIVIFSLLVLFMVIGIALNYSKQKKIIKDGVIFAVTLDGKEQTSFPDYNTGKYKVKINCNNASGVYKPVRQDDGTHKLLFVLENIVGKAACTLDFNTINENDQLNKRIMSYANGKYENGYRTVLWRSSDKEYGNYILFNDEIWRIIGVFETTLANGEKKMLTKIMNMDTIGAFNLTGNWPDSNLYKLLNGPYLNKEDGTSSDICVGGTSTVKNMCNFEDDGIGLNTFYGKMLENVVWNLGGMSTKNTDENYYVTNANNWYLYERKNIIYDGNSEVATGYVGLPYVSDYGLVVPSAYAGDDPSKWGSGKGGWQYDMLDSWFINPTSSNASSHFYLTNTGGIALSSGTLKYVKPVVYLSEDVYVISGTGIVEDPYIISM